METATPAVAVVVYQFGAGAGEAAGGGEEIQTPLAP